MAKEKDKIKERLYTYIANEFKSYTLLQFRENTRRVQGRQGEGEKERRRLFGIMDGKLGHVKRELNKL